MGQSSRVIDGKDAETAHAAPYFIQKNIALLYEQIMYFKKISRYVCPDSVKGGVEFLRVPGLKYDVMWDAFFGTHGTAV